MEWFLTQFFGLFQQKEKQYTLYFLLSGFIYYVVKYHKAAVSGNTRMQANATSSVYIWIFNTLSMAQMYKHTATHRWAMTQE